MLALRHAILLAIPFFHCHLQGGVPANRVYQGEGLAFIHFPIADATVHTMATIPKVIAHDATTNDMATITARVEKRPVRLGGQKGRGGPGDGGPSLVLDFDVSGDDGSKSFSPSKPRNLPYYNASTTSATTTSKFVLSKNGGTKSGGEGDVAVAAGEMIADVYEGNPSLSSLSSTGLSTQGILNKNATKIRDVGHRVRNEWRRELQSMPWIQRGGDIDGEAADDQSGYSVSLSSDGSVLAIGANLNDSSGKINAGHVRVYEFLNGSWTQRGGDIDGEASHDNSAMSVSLSSDGNVVAIGAHLNDPLGKTNAGHVRVYVYVNGIWTQRGGDIDGEASCDYLGQSVTLSGDGNVVAIGARAGYSSSDYAGHARIYKYGSGIWTKLGNNLYGEAAYDFSGHSVSLSDDGSVVAIGAYFNDPNGGKADAGHVRVYQFGSNGWSQRGGDIDGEAADDRSGRSVSLSSDGNVIAIGAYGNDPVGKFDAGHVRVYEFVSGTWNLRGGDIDGEATGDWSGQSVSLSGNGDVVAIGAIYNDGTSTDAGHVRVYQYANGAWTKRGSDIDGEAAGDSSGWSVSLSKDGNVVAIGAIYNDGTSSNAGHVRVYTSLPATASPSAKPTAVPTLAPTETPSVEPTAVPTKTPTGAPTAVPTSVPTSIPSAEPTTVPTSAPTKTPSVEPTAVPTKTPTGAPTAVPTLVPTDIPSAEPTAVPSSAPTSTPSAEPTAVPTSAPTGIPSTEPTVVPVQHPVFMTLPFVGACPPQISTTTLAYYEPGDKVTDRGVVFKCKPWPNSLYCNQEAFLPDINSRKEEWKQAWDVIGYCTGSVTPSPIGCPDTWVLGDMTMYKENDEVSVIKSSSASLVVKAIYKCKAWPSSWYCGQISPLNSNGGTLGWKFVGDCTGTIGPTLSPTISPETIIIAGCPPEYSPATFSGYKAGSQVSVLNNASSSSSFYRIVYQCREFPFSGYCNLKGFAPTEPSAYMAWIHIGPCDGTLAPTGAPTVYGGICTYTKVVSGTLTPVLPWSAGSKYFAGDQVRIGATKFVCKPYPYTPFCSLSAYAPSIVSENELWSEAWTLAGTCP